jgi:hypothetical protein
VVTAASWLASVAGRFFHSCLSCSCSWRIFSFSVRHVLVAGGFIPLTVRAILVAAKIILVDARVVPVDASFVPVAARVVPVDARVVPVDARVVPVGSRVVLVAARVVLVAARSVPVAARTVPVAAISVPVAGVAISAEEEVCRFLMLVFLYMYKIKFLNISRYTSNHNNYNTNCRVDVCRVHYDINMNICEDPFG